MGAVNMGCRSVMDKAPVNGGLSLAKESPVLVNPFLFNSAMKASRNLLEAHERTVRFFDMAIGALTAQSSVFGFQSSMRRKIGICSGWRSSWIMVVVERKVVQLTGLGEDSNRTWKRLSNAFLGETRDMCLAK